MSWTAVVPLKTRSERKSRLAELLSIEARAKLSIRMFGHVLGVLENVAAVDRIIVLADERPAAWGGDWILDCGRGLNTELMTIRKTLLGNMIVLHADLPLLTGEDVIALIDAANVHQLAIAPDRHGTGTNGLALSGICFSFAFGADSFRLHRKQLPSCAIIQRKGLGLDVDTPNDLKMTTEELDMGYLSS
ncbi:2-phospho-L-lactate guanylyltransferase [Sphingobium sp.]|uniref:2-phospho-L-lactate guanylyltransferase n=1 Tax=Sphingobium sp. TaxID=1912891 RepID=UPI0028BE0117|nr:2-phospho-L-lactate guanylyltransferase [Sphingobium sp.]